MFSRPNLTSAIAESYFNSRQMSILPLQYFDQWVTMLGDGILCIPSNVFIKSIVPAWYRLCPPQDKQIAPAMLCPSHTVKKRFATKEVENTAYLRSDIPLPPDLKTDPDLASFVAMRFPPAEQIRFVVISIAMQNETNWCIVGDVETRKCELVSCVMQKVEQRTVDEIVGAARWFIMYVSLKSCQPRYCFRNDIPFYYCTLLSMYYTHQRIGLAVSAENVIRSISEAQIHSFLDNFCVRQSLRRLSAVGEPQSLPDLLQRMRNVARCGKQRLRLQRLPEEHQRYIVEKLGCSVETHPNKPEQLYITWK